MKTLARKSEVEKKKDELRSLVGERHRDVIEASDTIQAMKDLSFTVANATRTLANHYSRLTASFSSDYE
ncbi:hypothetical protein X801_08662 [Opisthorchis viverrini]|uniref:Uncharacterized protein n=1 Tax=Opisthorchis viverrini TaxID=6198 RepID=A0A1S8WMB4_OPIVI|nr:hypothetical protein X801_08662 [Opisthorchis viverrini]